MTEMRHKLIPLRRANRYAGYQFWGRMKVDGLQGEEVFNYLILSIYQWILGKIQSEEDKKAESLQVPAPADYASVTADTFKPHHTNILFDLDITPVHEEKVWALRIREADHGTDGREPVIGRTFTTRVGVRLNGKGQTELAVKIDVADPATEENELEYAFRPGFVRVLAEQEKIHFEQVSELNYGKPFQVNTDEEYKKLLFMLDNDENQLPLVVFTYAHPGEMKDAAKKSMDEIMKSGQFDSFLKPSGIPMWSMGMSGFGQMPTAAPAIKETPILPYKTEKFCSEETFAFALTYVLGDKYTERFRKKIKKDFSPGDILLCGAKKFKGSISVFAYPGKNEKDLQKVYDEVLLAVRMYPKHKAPYDFGTTVFESEARNMDQQIRAVKLISSTELKGKKRIEELTGEIANLFKAIDDRDKRIRQLEGEKNEAFERGQDAGKKDIEKMNDTINEQARELASRRAAIEQMQSSYQQNALRDQVLEKIHTVNEWPGDNTGVVRFFLAAYGDRIDFTERGISTASKCDMKPEKVWDILYRVANPMVDLFRSGRENLSEKDVADAAGFDMSFREGTETREREEYMRYRRDTYQGKEISVEPHLKFRGAKNEADYQRLHFWYDKENQRIVIGYMGDHLPNAATRYAK